MTAHSLPHYASPNALTIWVDKTNIYVELPGPGADATIVSYPRNSLGLSKALDLLGVRADYAGTPEPLPGARPVKRIGTFMQHSVAEMLLREKGVIK